MSVLELRGVSKTYGEAPAKVHALDGVDLEEPASGDVLVGLPLIAAVGGWLLAGREPEVIARQPLD